MLKTIPITVKAQHYWTKKPTIPAQGNGRRLLNRLPHIQEQVEAIIRNNVDSGSHTNGVLGAELERRFKEAVNAAAAFALDCGSSAIRAACELLRLPPGSEVIIPAYTFIMTAYSVSDAFAVNPADGTFSKLGLVPVFVDVDPRTYTLDPLKARAAISDTTAAIIVVHMLGQMGDMRPLLELAEEYHLFLIEDAAQAHGATYYDPLTQSTWYPGSIGHFGCFSMSDVKVIGSMGADAGMLTVTQKLLDLYPEIAAYIRGWRNTGRLSEHRYRHQMWGIRARMDEYSAAECLAELAFLEVWTERRRSIAARYSAALAGSCLQPPYISAGRRHAFFNYMVKAPDVHTRKNLESRMKVAGIQVADAYTNVAEQELYRTGKLPCRAEALDVTKEITDLLVPIPCYPELTESEIERIEEVLAFR